MVLVYELLQNILFKYLVESIISKHSQKKTNFTYSSIKIDHRSMDYNKYSQHKPAMN